MACCLTAPSHYLNQCWLMISEVLWHSPDSNFTESTQNIYRWNEFEIYSFETVVKFPRGQWVKHGAHRGQPISQPHGWAMGYLLWIVERILTFQQDQILISKRHPQPWSHRQLNLALIEDNPYLNLMGELWVICCHYAGENWPFNKIRHWTPKKTCSTLVPKVSYQQRVFLYPPQRSWGGILDSPCLSVRLSVWSLTFRVRPVASTVQDGFFPYLVQMINSMRGCVACDDPWPWPISSR